MPLPTCSPSPPGESKAAPRHDGIFNPTNVFWGSGNGTVRDWAWVCPCSVLAFWFTQNKIPESQGGHPGTILIKALQLVTLNRRKKKRNFQISNLNSGGIPVEILEWELGNSDFQLQMVSTILHWLQFSHTEVEF